MVTEAIRLALQSSVSWMNMKTFVDGFIHYWIDEYSELKDKDMDNFEIQLKPYGDNLWFQEV